MKKNFLVFFLLFLWFLPIASFRLIDGDEGFYLYAAKLVSEGKTVYKDFFYPQTPFLPYIFNFWFFFTGISWISARWLQALIATGIGLILFKSLLRENEKTAKVGLFLFLLSGYVIGWFTVAKSYAICTFLIIIAHETIQSKSLSRPLRLLLSTFALGLAINIRLYIIALIPIFYVYSVTENQLPQKETPWFRKTTIWWRCISNFFYIILGLSVSFLPNFFLMSDLDSYIFNNITYHKLRTTDGLIGNMEQKIQVVIDMLLNIQFSVLTLFCICISLIKIKNKKLPSLAACISIMIIFVSLLPTPTYQQYFAISIPFLIIDSMPVLIDFYNRGHWKKKVFIGFILLYSGTGFFEMYQFLYSGVNVPGIGFSFAASGWKIKTVRKVTKKLDELVDDREAIITWWPGYLLESKKATILPGLENHFGIDVANKLTAEERAKYKIMSTDEVKKEISTNKVKLVLVGNWLDANIKLETDIVQKGYAIISTIDYTIFLKQKNNN